MNQHSGKPLFIAFEGIDGSGKSTQATLLTQALTDAGIQVHHTCEPTKREFGSRIREAFSNKKPLHELTIAALFVADRLDHLLNPDDGMLKMLNDGHVVITDRYYLSSFAYQSQFAPLQWLIEANAPCKELLNPDLTFYIDVSPEAAMNRITQNREETEAYETLQQLQQIHATYKQLIQTFQQQELIITINGEAEVSTIHHQILQTTLQYFPHIASI